MHAYIYLASTSRGAEAAAAAAWTERRARRCRHKSAASKLTGTMVAAVWVTAVHRNCVRQSVYRKRQSLSKLRIFVGSTFTNKKGSQASSGVQYFYGALEMDEVGVQQRLSLRVT